MPQTRDNGTIIPINADAWNLTTDLQTMADSIRAVTVCVNQAARDALIVYNGRVCWRTDLLQFEVWDGSAWQVQNALQTTAEITTFGTGWTAVATTAHDPRVVRVGKIVYCFGGLNSSSTAAASNMCTVPTAFRPPDAGTRFIGGGVSSNGSHYTLAMAGGVISIPPGYENITVATAQVVPIQSFWSLD